MFLLVVSCFKVPHQYNDVLICSLVFAALIHFELEEVWSYSVAENNCNFVTLVCCILFFLLNSM